MPTLLVAPLPLPMNETGSVTGEELNMNHQADDSCKEVGPPIQEKGWRSKKLEILKKKKPFFRRREEAKNTLSKSTANETNKPSKQCQVSSFVPDSKEGRDEELMGQTMAEGSKGPELSQESRDWDTILERVSFPFDEDYDAITKDRSKEDEAVDEVQTGGKSREVEMIDRMTGTLPEPSESLAVHSGKPLQKNLDVSKPTDMEDPVLEQGRDDRETSALVKKVRWSKAIVDDEDDGSASTKSTASSSHDGEKREEPFVSNQEKDLVVVWEEESCLVTFYDTLCCGY